MKGTLNKTNRGWVVKQVVKEGTHAKLINQYPLIDNGHIDGLKLYDSNEGSEVDFEIVNGYDNNGPDYFPKFARILTPEEAELKDWDVTLNDGLEDEVWDEKLIQELINETVPEPFATPEELQEKPYVSDDFQIGPDGAYEHIEEWNTLPKEKASELVDKFSNECLLTTDGGKVAALIAVDEIKRILYDQDSMIRYDYWFEVKKEIEKL